MEIKVRSKSTYIPEKYHYKPLGINDGPRIKIKDSEILLSPINLNAKGFKDLRKNKCSALLDSNSYYLSCPEVDDMNDTDCSIEIERKPKKSIGLFSLEESSKPHQSISDKKYSKKLSYKLMNEDYNSLVGETNHLSYQKHAFDCLDISISKKKSFDMQLDKSHSIRPSVKPSLSMKRESKTTKMSFKKQLKFKEDDFILEEDSEEEYNELAPSKKNVKSSVFTFEVRTRSVSSILSKLEFMKNEKIDENESE